VATVVRCVTSGSDSSGFVQMSRESPRESHVRTGRVLVLSFLQFIDKQFLNVPLHVLCTFFLYFDIIKGSAYGSYSLRTVFASIVCGPWFSGVFGVRLLNPLDCSVLRGELCFVFGSICSIIGLFRSQGRTLLRVWIDLCDYWIVPFSGENFASCLDRFVRLLTAVPFSRRTLLCVWIDLCDYWTVPFSRRTLLRVWIDLCEY